MLYAYEGSAAEVGAALEALDVYEGVGQGYVRALVEVLPLDPAGLPGEPCQAHAYLATPDAIVNGLRPYHWYRELVLAGARHHGLPAWHCEAIAHARVIIDADEQRCRQAEQILAGAPDLAAAQDHRPGGSRHAPPPAR
ncbi:MAG: gamma-glutamylcyclotransferase [Burkholderiaceae bacterium]